MPFNRGQTSFLKDIWGVITVVYSQGELRARLRWFQISCGRSWAGLPVNLYLCVRLWATSVHWVGPQVLSALALNLLTASSWIHFPRTSQRVFLPCGWSPMNQWLVPQLRISLCEIHPSMWVISTYWILGTDWFVTKQLAMVTATLASHSSSSEGRTLPRRPLYPTT